MWYSVLVLLGWCAVTRGQITCVSSCEDSVEIGVFSSIRECCDDESAGGFLRGEGICSSCTPFRVVDPQISFSFDPEIPVEGEPFTATCSASINPDLSGSIQLQWRNERGEVIVVGTGTNTTEISFTIERFSMADSTVIGGYNCRAAILAADEMRTYDIVIGRNILFTSTTSSSSITSCGDFTEGSQFQLTCTVMGVSRAPIIMWFGPPGMLGFSANGVEVGDIVSMGDTYSRSIRFTSLSQDIAGRYLCMNTVTNPAFVEHTLFLANRDIVATTPAMLGRPFAAQCNVSVPVRLSATVQTELLSPTGRVLASDIGVGSAEAVFLLPSLEESSLGKYRCRTTVFSNQLDTPVLAEQSFSVDVERCATSPVRCARDPSSMCVDTEDGPVCECRSGYMRIMNRCMNKNECRMDLSNCSDDAVCTDTPGSFICTCRPGFIGYGVTCTDVNECEVSKGVCSSSETCVNTNGSFICIVTEIPQLEPVNECEEGDGPCDTNALCTDTFESFNCTCKEGYTGNGTICTDIDECSIGMNDCDPNATCINLSGAYLCRCNTGFFGTGYTCKKFDVEDPTIMTPDDEPTICAETAPQQSTYHTHTRHRHRHPHHTYNHHTHTRHHHTHTRHTHHTHTRHHHTHTRHTHTRASTNPTPCMTFPAPSDDEEDTTMRRTTRPTRRRNTPHTPVRDEGLGDDSTTRQPPQRPSEGATRGGTPRGRSRGRVTPPGGEILLDEPPASTRGTRRRTRHRTREHTQHHSHHHGTRGTHDDTTHRKTKKSRRHHS